MNQLPKTKLYSQHTDGGFFSHTGLDFVYCLNLSSIAIVMPLVKHLIA